MTATSQLIEALRGHYIKPGQPYNGGVFVPEVSWNGGYGGRTRCDAVWVGFTANSGYLMVGHEVKVSRSDWLHELDNPGKADPWSTQCHQWQIVAPPGVVQPGEVPANCGLLEPATRGRRFRQIVSAPVRDVQPSWNAARSVMARLDTLQGVEAEKTRRQLEASAREDLDGRVADEVARRLADRHGGTDLALAVLDWLQTELGVTINDHERTWSKWNNTIPLDTLQRAVTLVKAQPDMSDLVRNTTIAANYLTSSLETVGVLQTKLAELSAATKVC